MRIDRRDIGKYYASLDDQELLAMKREDLTPDAQNILDLEISRRGQSLARASDLSAERIEASYKEPEGPVEDPGSGADWHDDGTLVCSFPDTQSDSGVEKAARAQDALEAAGIPSQMRVLRASESDVRLDHDELQIFVPLGLAMNAASILDRDFFNEEFENEWRDHLKILSDNDLLLLDPKIFCAGILDKAARMQRAYSDEMSRRKLKTQGA